MNKSLFGFSSYLKRVLTRKDGLRIDADIATKTKGPEGVTAGVVAVFDGDTGKILKSSGYHESSYTRNAATQTLTNKTLNNPKFTQATTLGNVPVATGSNNEITWLNPHDRVNLYNSEEDLNDFRTPGVYIFSTQGYREAINAPVFPNDNSFLLEVFRYTPGDVTGSTYQRITYFRHDATNSYFRTGTSSGWTPWKRVLSDDDVTDLPSTSTFGRVYIEDNTDLDDLVDPGIYSVASIGSFNSLSNTPPITGSYGNIVVLQVGGSSRTQQYWPSAGEKRVFTRSRSGGGVWGNWIEILTETSNAATATKLAAPVTIQGKSFDGSSNITLDYGTTAKEGLVRLATNTEAATGTDSNRVITPATLKHVVDQIPAGGGDVVGPSSSVNNRAVLFDGTSGKVIKDSGKTLPSGDIIGTTDTQTLTNKTLNNPKFTQATTLGNVPVATGSDGQVIWKNPFERSSIEDDYDLDNLTDPGIYAVSSSSSFNSLSNTPPISGSYGVFIVLQVGGTSRTQQYWPSVGEQRIFIRARSGGGVWTNWLEILTTDSDIVEAAWSPKSISNGDDLNDYDVPGTYNIASTAIFNSLSNKPPVTDKHGCIVVLRNGANTRVQIFYNANANSGLTDVWIRRKSGASTWENWAKFLTTDDTVGDVVGPASSSNNYFAQFDGTTGKLLKSVSLASAVPLASRTTTLAGTSSAGYISAREVGYYRDWSSATYSTSTAIPFASYLNWFITVSADITFNNPSSVVAGKAGTLRLYASSKRTIDWGSYFKWPGDLGKPTEIPAGKYLVVSYVCYSTTVIYCSWAIYSD